MRAGYDAPFFHLEVALAGLEVHSLGAAQAKGGLELPSGSATWILSLG